MSDLKRCPFCGGKANDVQSLMRPRVGKVYCTVCGCELNGDSEQEAHDRWNRRADDWMPINIIFDGPPAHESGRFVEVETDDGKSINVGGWIERHDGCWALRITSLPDPPRKDDGQEVER